MTRQYLHSRRNVRTQNEAQEQVEAESEDDEPILELVDNPITFAFPQLAEEAALEKYMNNVALMK